MYRHCVLGYAIFSLVHVCGYVLVRVCVHLYVCVCVWWGEFPGLAWGSPTSLLCFLLLISPEPWGLFGTHNPSPVHSLWTDWDRIEASQSQNSNIQEQSPVDTNSYSTFSSGSGTELPSPHQSSHDPRLAGTHCKAMRNTTVYRHHQLAHTTPTGKEVEEPQVPPPFLELTPRSLRPREVSRPV